MDSFHLLIDYVPFSTFQEVYINLSLPQLLVYEVSRDIVVCSRVGELVGGVEVGHE